MIIKLIAPLVVLTLWFQNTNGQILTKNDIKLITDQIENLINEHYVFQENKKRIVSGFQQKVKSGKYNAITSPDSLAGILSNDLRSISNDGHLYVRYLSNNDTAKKDVKDWEKQELEQEIRSNYGFREVQILENNTGYIKITEFMHPQRAMQTAVAAMKLVESTDALIIDLRGNGGGYPGIMEYILNHYFDGPPTLLSTTFFGDSTLHPAPKYTSDLIYGKLRLGTPLCILIDKNTASAAEYFAYTLQAHKKAVVVGETSAGAANMNSFFPLPHNLRISISTASPVNEITKTNWEQRGVQPDYPVNAEDAKDKSMEIIASGLFCLSE
ncbi:S41 family peptidase [Sphingobacterium sp. SGR-19]|uniref:S41 family peptidase n=1 Tax=Sphingobacterium sp. SGR-19 TaxID=2710886 RepID=UPI0013ECA082|nr:S41 family peptidase [Sphingobacterium sp. SGR-19]NGM64137.1 S41 family peptidase [Sphingobacterium sp. SGR-19]